jgi:cyclohexyl-isocyanide hydratase
MADNGALSVGFLLFPDMTQLDLTGPFEIFARLPGSVVHLVWQSLEPVRTERGLVMVPSTTFASCPPLDLLCVPGGPGQVGLMEDDEVLGFLRRAAGGCRYVTSVCTGALVLGAAGLLSGYRATTHWAALDQLSLFGAVPVDERIVFDRDRITCAGVTAGLDFALAVAARIAGEDAARRVQLQIEYAPDPPFDAGSPAAAGQEVLRAVTEASAASWDSRLAASRRAASRVPGQH